MSESRDDLALAHRRLTAAYQQTLRFVEVVRRIFVVVHGALCQSLLGLCYVLVGM
ncbi:MAG: hypothetical protein HYS37_14335, partial [Candidatus Rokubacteria bacterium]|nr:hypothetical protein [Candidatus Rokubacteria bacterium]